MKHLGDICKIHNAPNVWIVCGGSPCQDLSVAGLRKGLKHSDKGDEETTRSGLFMEQIRVTKEMRENDRRNGRTGKLIRPRFFVWENVPGALSSGTPAGEDFRIVLEEVARIAEPDANVPRPSEPWTNSGCIVGSGWSLAWRISDNQFWGTPQRRKRIALVADFGGECAPKILFERSSLQRDSSESEGARERIARPSADGLGEAISFQDRCGCDGGARESLSSETEQVPCPPCKISSYCIGGGQVNDAVGMEREICKTLNCMDDPMKILAPRGFAESQIGGYSEDVGTLRASGGSRGGAAKHLLSRGGALHTV